MEKGTFGSVEEFKMLIAVYDLLDKVKIEDKANKTKVFNKVNKIITNYNIYCKEISVIKNMSFRKHILGIIKRETLEKIVCIKNDISKILFEHLNCFIVAKYRNELKK